MKKLLPALLLTAACGAGLVDHGGIDLPTIGGGSLQCTLPQQDCGTGVCVNLDSDVNNCGACGHLCVTPQFATNKCEASTCGFKCKPGYFACGSDRCCQASSIAAGGDTTCAVVDNNVWCWGSNDSAQLGSPPTGASWSAMPVKVPGVPAASSVAVGQHHACAILAGSGEVMCWGANDSTQLGAAGGGIVKVLNVAGALALVLGDRHSCAIMSSGVFCWGANDLGQLGQGTFSATAGPAAVPGLVASSISAGTGFTCAVSSGATHCWGDGSKGQFGDGAVPQPSAAPVLVNVSTSSAVALGASHACAIGSATWCWGSDDFGQASGDGRGSVTPSPVRGVGVQSAFAIAAGIEHSCAISATRGVVCWGGNGFAQLGLGLTSGISKPIAVPGLGNVQALAVGARHSCAQTADGAVYCWGSNGSGQAAALASTAVLAPRPID